MKKKNRKLRIFLSLLIIIIFIGMLFIINKIRGDTILCFPNKCIAAEVASTSAKRSAGLMFREELAEDTGMLFIFEKEGIHSFWMKNTYIPLDIIWVDSDFKIVHIEHATPCKADPCKSYNPGKNSLYVVEVNSGFVEKYDIEIGDKIEIK